MRCLIRFSQDESGVTAIEYALIGSIVSIAIVIGATALGSTLNGIFQSIASNL